MNRECLAKTRGGFFLVEMLVVVATLPLFLVLVGGVFTALSRDIPRSSQVVVEQSLILRVLDQIRGDVDHAQALLRSYGGRSADPSTLLIQGSAGVTCYQVAQGRVVRTQLGPGEDPNEPAQEWMIPNASIRWTLWGLGETASAVEVHTHMLLKLRARDQQRLANTHVFFPVCSPSEVAP